MNTKRGAAALSILSNAILVVMKLLIGIITHSVSVVSEAAHSAIDLAASVIAFFSVRAADVPPDEDHPFGHGKYENISGVVEALLIFIAAAYIVYEALHRLPLALSGKVEVQPSWGLMVMGISVVANHLISGLLFRVAKKTDSVALEADGHHLRTDVWTSLGVFGGLLAMRIMEWLHLPGAAVVDSVVAIAVALLIVKVAWTLTRDAGRPLLDTTLPEHEVQQVVDILLSEKQIAGFHKLRTRKAGSYRHIDVHVLVAESFTVGQAHDLAEVVEDRIREVLPDTHVVTHIEPATEEHIRKTPQATLTECKVVDILEDDQESDI